MSNLVSCYVALCLLFGAFAFHLWYFYCVWFVFGTLAGLWVPFVGPRILAAPENLAPSATFLFVNACGLLRFIRANVSEKSFRTIVVTLLFVFPFAAVVAFASGRVIPMFTGRILQLLQPSAAYRVPEVAAVLEHQPGCWSVFYLNCGPLLYLFPVGVFFLFRERQFLLVVLAVVSLYFAAVMMRLVHVFMIAFVIATSVALDKLFTSVINCRRADSVIAGVFLAVFAVLHVNHSVYFAFNALADNHLNFQVETSEGIRWSRDHVEAYRWLFENTDPNSKVMASWDLGYQISSFAGRSVYTDGNTNNFTHMRLIGLVVASPEETAWRLARMIGADYYVATFGGVSAFPEDDIAKFHWIARSIERTFPNISADKYQNKQTPFLVGQRVRKAVRSSLIFRAAYYRFGKLRVFTDLKKGTDLARGVEVGALDFELNSFAEVYTTENWMVRIYRVAPDPMWDRVTD
jgi:dolichyl-diphosphooligosaccharide--protein glycosyltransferase